MTLHKPIIKNRLSDIPKRHWHIGMRVSYMVLDNYGKNSPKRNMYAQFTGEIVEYRGMKRVLVRPYGGNSLVQPKLCDAEKLVVVA